MLASVAPERRCRPRSARVPRLPRYLRLYAVHVTGFISGYMPRRVPIVSTIFSVADPSNLNCSGSPPLSGWQVSAFLRYAFLTLFILNVNSAPIVANASFNAIFMPLIRRSACGFTLLWLGEVPDSWLGGLPGYPLALGGAAVFSWGVSVFWWLSVCGKENLSLLLLCVALYCLYFLPIFCYII